MNDVEISVIEIDGNQYFLVDTLDAEKGKYYYFSNMKENKDLKVLKEDGEDFISLDTEQELEYALSLFYEKYKDYDVENENTN